MIPDLEAPAAFAAATALRILTSLAEAFAFMAILLPERAEL